MLEQASFFVSCLFAVWETTVMVAEELALKMHFPLYRGDAVVVVGQ